MFSIRLISKHKCCKHTAPAHDRSTGTSHPLTSLNPHGAGRSLATSHSTCPRGTAGPFPPPCVYTAATRHTQPSPSPCLYQTPPCDPSSQKPSPFKVAQRERAQPVHSRSSSPSPPGVLGLCREGRMHEEAPTAWVQIPAAPPFPAE